jgi:hypothetical protein
VRTHARLQPTGGNSRRCQRRLLSLIKSKPIARKILVAMHLPADVPELHPARPPPGRDREEGEAEDCPEDGLN